MRKCFLLLISLLIVSAAGAAPLAGEIAHYPMREGTGTQIFEAKKRLPPGNIKRSFWTVRDTLPLVDFGGMKTSSTATVHLPEIKIENDFTIAVWINAYWWKNNWATLVYRSDATYGLRGNRSCPGQLHFRVKEPGVRRGANLMSNMVLERNKWYHVAAVFKAGQYMRLYINGKLDSQMTEKVPGKLGDDKSRFRLGGSKNNYFAGTMTDLHFYNRALTDADIAYLYKQENRFTVDTGDEKKLLPVKPALQFAKSGMQLDILPGGAMEIADGNSRYRVESMYSYPSEPRMKFNYIDAQNESKNEKSWQLKFAKKSTDKIEFTAQGSTLQLQRTVEFMDDNRVRISDKFINPTDKDQAVVFYHRITPFNKAEGNHWYLYGQEKARSPWDARLASANPTGFIKFGEKALAFVAEDDIFRCHLTAAVRDRSDGRMEFDFGSNRIGVPAGKSHTIEYTLYLLKGDYFDFINRLRKDWNVPVQTLNGPFGLIRIGAFRSEVYKRFAADPEAFRKEFIRRNMRIITLNPWFNYHDGDIYKDWNDYKDHMQKAMKIIREANPEAKFLASLETYTYCIGEEDFTTPPPEGFSWEKVTAGTQQRVKESPWKDSASYNKQGKINLYSMNRNLAGRKRNSLPLSVHPVRGSHFYHVRLKEFDFLLDEVKMDGIYQDMFGFSAPNNIVFHKWDGFSVVVRPNGTIGEKYTQMAPLTAPARADWLRKIISKGKLALTNFGAPTTRELQTIPYMNFCEAAGKGVGRQNLDSIPPDSSGCAMNQLSTPLAYGPHRSEEIDAVRLMARVRAYLRYGCLYIHTSFRNSFPASGPKSGEYGPINHMYPITPIELHRGWVKGKERIVSCVSYKTIWQKESQPRALRFDAVGREIPVGDAVKISGKNGNWNIEVKIDDWKEFLILE